MKFGDEIRLTELRKYLGETVKTVWENKEPVLIKSHEKAIAAIVPLDMLERIDEQSLVRAERALDSFMANDAIIDTAASFDNIKGNEQTLVSPEIEKDLQHMQDEESSEKDVKYWRDKCAGLQKKIKRLSSWRFVEQSYGRVVDNKLPGRRFAKRSMLSVTGDNVKIEFVSAAATSKKFNK